MALMALPVHCITCRASKQVTLIFSPKYRKQYKLQLRCRTSTVAPVVAAPSLRPSSGSFKAKLPPLESQASTNELTTTGSGGLQVGAHWGVW